MKIQNKKGLLFMGGGLVLITMALVLLFYNQWEGANTANNTAEAFQVLQEKIDLREYVDVALDTSPEKTMPDTETTLSEPIIEVDGYDYIGYLTIPALLLELPVMDEWDYARLKIAPCRYIGGVLTNNLVICGHNYTQHFGLLYTLEIGDTIAFTDASGGVYRFAVAEIETVSPAAVVEVTESEYPLTLFTCTYGGRTRVVVRCTAVQ